MSAENTSPLLSNKATESYDIYSDGDDQQKQLGFVKEFGYESKRLWKLAGPAIFTSISQYSLGALTQTFAGRVGELELAAFAVENSVIAGLAFGVMVIIYLFIYLSIYYLILEIISLFINLNFCTKFSWEWEVLWRLYVGKHSVRGVLGCWACTCRDHGSFC